MIRRIIVSTFFILLFGESASPQLPTTSSQDSCLNYIKWYSNYWLKDKKGKNGFRELFGTVVKKYSIVGLSWSEIDPYLGKPNRKYQRGNTWTYRYYLNFVNHPSRIGQQIMDIGINEKGIITDFHIWEVDG